MRILMVLTEFPPRIGGMQAHAHAIVSALRRRGHRLEIATYRNAAPDDGCAAARFDRSLRVPVHRVLSRVAHHASLRRIESLARAGRPDLIYCSTVFFGALRTRLDLPVVARSVGNDVLRPWVVYPFRVGSEWLATPWFEDRLYAWFRTLEWPDAIEAFWKHRRRQLMIEAARELSCVLANSEFTRDALRAIGVHETRIRVLPGGVDGRRPALSTTARAQLRARFHVANDRYLLVTACRLEKKKGVDLLIDSMPGIVAAIPEAMLLIVGDGRLGRRLRAQAALSPVADRVHFAGAVAHAAMPDYYAAADVFVLASRTEESRIGGFRDAETMGRVLCEANAAGVPVVAARSGGIPSVVRDGDNGLLFEPDDPSALVATLGRVHGQPVLARALIAAGRRRARDEFDWAVIADAHEHCFAEVLAASASHGQQGAAP